MLRVLDQRAEVVSMGRVGMRRSPAGEGRWTLTHTSIFCIPPLPILISSSSASLIENPLAAVVPRASPSPRTALPEKKGLMNGPKFLKTVPVIVFCKKKPLRNSVGAVPPEAEDDLPADFGSMDLMALPEKKEAGKKKPFVATMAPCLPEPDDGLPQTLDPWLPEKVLKYMKGLRNGPRNLKPVPVIIRDKFHVDKRFATLGG